MEQGTRCGDLLAKRDACTMIRSSREREENDMAPEFSVPGEPVATYEPREVMSQTKLPFTLACPNTRRKSSAASSRVMVGCGPADGGVVHRHLPIYMIHRGTSCRYKYR